MRLPGRPRLYSIALVLIAAFGLPAASEATGERRIVVEIKGSKFVPENVSVRPGELIVWRNLDIVPHTATAKDASWDSGLIPPGREWEMVITDKTAVDYYCVFHPSMIAVLGVASQ